MAFASLVLSIAQYVVAPIFVFKDFKRDPFILLFGIFGLFTMNTTLMAVIRDCGGMEWLKQIGRQPWFKYQYDVAYWMWLLSSLMLVIFLLRLAISGKGPAQKIDSR